VLTHRAALVEALYDGSADVLLPRQGPQRPA
jgi:hypothetical protein